MAAPPGPFLYRNNASVLVFFDLTAWLGVLDLANCTFRSRLALTADSPNTALFFSSDPTEKAAGKITLAITSVGAPGGNSAGFGSGFGQSAILELSAPPSVGALIPPGSYVQDVMIEDPDGDIHPLFDDAFVVNVEQGVTPVPGVVRQ